MNSVAISYDPETEEMMMRAAARKTVPVSQSKNARGKHVDDELKDFSQTYPVKKHSKKLDAFQLALKESIERSIQAEWEELESRVRSGHIQRIHFQALESRIRSGEVNRDNFKDYLNKILANQLAQKKAE